MLLLLALLACAPASDDSGAWNDACAAYLITTSECIGPERPIDPALCRGATAEHLACMADVMADGCDPSACL